MEIFGIGLPELLIIAVVALIILGPERLPETFRTIGKGVGEFRRAIEPARNAWAEVTREVNAATTDVTKVTGNPWTVHPLAEGLNEQERERFFAYGELPEWKQNELDKYSRDGSETAAPVGTDETEVSELDYPMPHGPVERSAAGVTEPLEELLYPAPGKITKED